MPDESPADTTTSGTASTTTSSASSTPAKPTAQPSTGTAADPATAAEYASQPDIVTAVQYAAPDGADEAGNLDEIAGLGVEVTKQEPWDPAGGQNCILIGYPVDEGDLPVRFLVQPGQYVAVRPGANAFEVYDAEQFAQLYSRTK